jgi:hypothetical protein
MRLSLRRLSFDNTILWVGLLVSFFIVLNVAGCFIFVFSHPNLGFWEQIWGYAESEPPKLIAASLVLPLLVFLIEGNFNVTENIKKNRQEERKQIRNEHNKARLTTREVSAEMWVKLCRLADEVIYWDRRKDLGDVLKQMATFTVEVENIVLSWSITLPCLQPESRNERSAVGNRNIEGFFLLFINAILSCADSVAQHLRLATNDQERDELQQSLALIKWGINSLCHYNFLGILENAAEIEDLREKDADEESEGSTAESQDKLAALIRSEFDALSEWSQEIREKLKGDQLWPTEQGAALDDFRAEFDAFENWLSQDENLEKGLADWDHRTEFDSALDAIPSEVVLSGQQITYSKPWLKEFGRLLAYSLIESEALARAAR